MNIPDFYIEPANYASDVEELRYLRTLVFVEEQLIPSEIEFDDLDPQCLHFLARDGQAQAIGTGRLTADGRIGRMAVVKEWRGQGVGRSLLRALLEKAGKLGLTSVVLDAQLSALGFYEQHGFEKDGEVYAKAGIAHQPMRLAIEALVNPVRGTSKPLAESVEAERIETLESIVLATEQLINAARRQLCIFSRDLDFKIYGQSAIAEALKQFALRNRGDGVRIILQEPANLAGQMHPVLALAQRLPSHIQLRAPEEAEDQQYLPAFAINDGGYLFRPLGNRYEGHWSPNLPARNRQLRDEFEQIWQRSRICTEFRALAL